MTCCVIRDRTDDALRGLALALGVKRSGSSMVRLGVGVDRLYLPDEVEHDRVGSVRVVNLLMILSGV